MANQNPNDPWTKQMEDELIANLKNMDAIQLQIEKAKRAGIDVGDAEKTFKETKQRLLQLKSVYAPNRSI